MSYGQDNCLAESCNPFLQQSPPPARLPSQAHGLRYHGVPATRPPLCSGCTISALLRARSFPAEGAACPTKLPVWRTWVPSPSLRGKGLISAPSIHQGHPACSPPHLPPLLYHPLGLGEQIFLPSGGHCAGAASPCLTCLAGGWKRP